MNASGTLHVRPSLLALLVGRKQTTVRDQVLPPNPPVRPFDSRAQGFSTSDFCSSTIDPPSALAEFGAEHDMLCVCVVQRPTRISVAAPPASRVTPNWRSEEAPPMDTIFSQPKRRRVSTDRLNRLDNQLVASLQRESGPTPAGKTLPHSGHTHIAGDRFRRERGWRTQLEQICKIEQSRNPFK